MTTGVQIADQDAIQFKNPSLLDNRSFIGGTWVAGTTSETFPVYGEWSISGDEWPGPLIVISQTRKTMRRFVMLPISVLKKPRRRSRLLETLSSPSERPQPGNVAG